MATVKISLKLITELLNNSRINITIDKGAITIEGDSLEAIIKSCVYDDERGDVNTNVEVYTVNDYNIPLCMVPNNIDRIFLKELAPAFEKIDRSKSTEEQIDSFIREIGIADEGNEDIIKNAFVIALRSKKITYNNIIGELKKRYTHKNEVMIKKSLIGEFEKWLQKYPKLFEQSYTLRGKISFTSLLKLFAKYIGK